MGLREQQKLETKRKIAEAVNKLSTAKGIENVKVRDICEEASISIGTFYNYYDSIDSILIDSITLNAESSKEVYKMILVNEDEIVNFEMFIRHEIGTFRSTPQSVIKEVWHIFQYYPEAEILALNRTTFDVIYGMVTRGIEKGQISNVLDPAVMTKMILKLIIGNCFINSMHKENFDFTDTLIEEVNAIIKVR